MDADLGAYDGSAGTIVDTDVWIDCADPDSEWHAWAVDQLHACSERSPLHVNLVIYTELLVPRSDTKALDDLLDVFETRRSALPWACAALTARAFATYRERGDGRARPMPDFYIGAHAAVANLNVLTRNAQGYRRYYPKLRLITP